MDRITKAYDDEIATLKRKLEVVERSRRAWIEANNPVFIDAYIEDVSAGKSEQCRDAVARNFHASYRSSRNQAAYSAIESLLRVATDPVPTANLLQHVEQLGIQIGGANPKNTLSAMLSTSSRFTSHGRSGWTLATAEEQTSRNVWEGSQGANEHGGSTGADTPAAVDNQSQEGGEAS